MKKKRSVKKTGKKVKKKSFLKKKRVNKTKGDSKVEERLKNLGYW